MEQCTICDTQCEDEDRQMSLDIWLTDSEVVRHNVDVYDGNITHNLSAMWREAECRDALYDCGGKKAGEILPILIEAHRQMKLEPDRFTQHDAPNGWGTYEHAVIFLTEIIEACKTYPDAIIGVSK